VLRRSTKIDRLLTKTSKAQSEILFKEFTRYVLNLYKSLLLHAIKNQKFPKRYPPLNRDYVKYKRLNRMKKGFWQATGFSQVELTTWRIKKGHYAIGFKKNLIHPASGEKVWKIHNYVERGTSKIPPRPLYWPIARSIQRHLYDVHFKAFIKKLHPELERFLD
jgi:hypothetical protein